MLYSDHTYQLLYKRYIQSTNQWHFIPSFLLFLRIYLAISSSVCTSTVSPTCESIYSISGRIRYWMASTKMMIITITILDVLGIFFVHYVTVQRRSQVKSRLVKSDPTSKSFIQSSAFSSDYSTSIAASLVISR
jgi:hypothetical protein